MAKYSAGILLYFIRPDSGVLEVLIVHPGGPFWAQKNLGAWSIPKGEYDPEAEDPWIVARREFNEEIGIPPPEGAPHPLGEVRQPSGKRVTVFALEGHCDVSDVRSNLVELEWPRGSGKTVTFPEIDRAAWMSVDAARKHLLVGHVVFVDRACEMVRATGVKFLESTNDAQAALFE